MFLLFFILKIWQTRYCIYDIVFMFTEKLIKTRDKSLFRQNEVANFVSCLNQNKKSTFSK